MSKQPDPVHEDRSDDQGETRDAVDEVRARQSYQLSLNHWAALVFYCEDNRAEISNVLAENALRCVALGRKNYLFVGSYSGGERAAAMCSLIGTCKLNGINPRAYLEHVLTDELLPWNVADKLKPATPPAPATG